MKEPPIELNEAAKLEREIGDFTVEGKIERGGEWHEMVNRWGIEVRNGEKSARWTLESSPGFYHLKPTFSGCSFRWAYNHDNTLACSFFSSLSLSLSLSF